MKCKHIILVQPLGQLTSPSGYMRTCYLEPIGLEYLAAALDFAGYSTEIVSGEVSEEAISKLVTQSRPMAVGFSVHSYIVEHSLRLAEVAKQAAQESGYDLLTVFGGPHPTACSVEVAGHNAVDFVVRGEGEETLVELLNAVLHGGDYTTIVGLAFQEEDGVRLTDSRARIRDLDSVPWPKRSHQFLDIAKQYQIAYPPPGNQVRIAQVMYSRGCPFSCSFCSAENAWGREVAWRSPSAVLDEIESLVEEYGTNLIYFPDLTFNVNRERAIDLCDEFRRRRPPVHWWGLFRADLLDNELLRALREAGCVKISLGVESADHNLASNLKGDYKAKQAQVHESLVEADRLGFIIKAFLILGFPDETEELILGYPDRFFDQPIDELRITFATPFPGTRFFEECLAGELIPQQPLWSTFTTEAPVLRHPTMTDEKLMVLREELVTGFYLDRRYAQHAQNKLMKFPHLQQSWIEFFQFLGSKGVFAQKEKSLAALLDVLHATNPLETMTLDGSGNE